MRFSDFSAVLLIFGASIMLFGCGENNSPSTQEAGAAAGTAEPYSEKEASDLIKKVDAGEPFSLVDRNRLKWRDVDITFLKPLPAKKNVNEATCFSEGRIAITAEAAIVELVLTDGRRVTGLAKHYGSGKGFKELDKKLRQDYFALRSMGRNRAYAFSLQDAEMQDKLRFSVSRGKGDVFTLKVSYQKNEDNLLFCASNWVASQRS